MSGIRTIGRADPVVTRPRRVLAPAAACLGGSVGVIAITTYFLQHFPATMLAAALVLLALGRLAPVLREVAGRRTARLARAGLDFAGVGLLAVVAVEGASGEIDRALTALWTGGG